MLCLLINLIIFSEDKWVLQDGMFFTCPDFDDCRDDASGWQNIVSKEKPPVSSINIDEYKIKFKGMRKKKNV